MSEPTKKYIGDGVYVEADGWHVILTTERAPGQIDKIYLEWAAMKRLLVFAEDVFDVKIAVQPREKV